MYLRGNDRVDFLQRQSTNDLRHLSDTRAIATVLTSPAARILDVLLVFVVDEETFGVLSLTDRTTQTYNHLRSKIFFMDHVTLEVDTSPWVQIPLLGDSPHPQIPAPFPAGENVAALDGGGWRFAPQGNALPTQTLLVPQKAAKSWQQQLIQSGVSYWEADEWLRWRIHNGIPGASEWQSAYTPLETGLESLVARNKGCYTGQEVITRQHTYDKVTRHLCHLRAEVPFEANTPVVNDQGRRVGEVTSTDGHGEGLGVLRKPSPLANEILFVQGVQVKARVSPRLKT